MPDVFISYSTVDEAVAKAVQATFQAHGLNAFMASSSLQPGAIWADEIQAALKASPTVLCLMSKAACASPYVNQESGMAVHGQKRIIPVVWDMDPAELPGWLRKYQALDLRQYSVAEYAAKLTGLAADVRSTKDKQQLVFICALVALAFILLLTTKQA